MATTKKRKVDFKSLAKTEVKKKLITLFKEEGFSVDDCAIVSLEGFSKDTIIVRGVVAPGLSDDTVDVQIKLITPNAKAGNHYLISEEEEEKVATTITTTVEDLGEEVKDNEEQGA